MHILFLSDNFPPEVNAPASRTYEHTREWVKAGHQVTVITCAPNFPKGSVFSGYRNRLWQREIIEGVVVIRVWSYITANEGFTKRVLDYTSYMATATLAALFVRRVDIVVGTSPQFFTACAAYAVGTIKRIPWVFELRDLWPESIRAVGAMKASAILDALEKVELFLYRKATAIVSVTHSFRDELIRRGIEEAKISVITNGVDIGRFQPRAKDAALLNELGLEGKFVAGYIGTHGLAHALDTLLDAAHLLNSATDGDRYKLLLLGDGACKAALMARASAERLDNIVFVDSVSKDEVARYWSLLDVAIIHLKATPLFETVIPSKLFECMGMAIPVLHGVSGESARIVEREQVGLTFKSENPAALCEGLHQLHDDVATYQQFKANGPVAARHYDRTELALRMLKLLGQTVDSRVA
jgi:glycosyltransferase involved in cell wall biosynthesis